MQYKLHETCCTTLLHNILVQYSESKFQETDGMHSNILGNKIDALAFIPIDTYYSIIVFSFKK